MFEPLLLNIEQMLALVEKIERGEQSQGQQKTASLQEQEIFSQLQVLNTKIPLILGSFSVIEQKTPKKQETPLVVKPLPVIPKSSLAKKDLKETSKEILPKKNLLPLGSPLNSGKEKEGIREIIARQKKKEPEKKQMESFKSSSYATVSNALFRKFSEKSQKNFSSLSEDLMKSNSRTLTTTYLSMMFFSIGIASVVAVTLFIVLLFIDPVFLRYAWMAFLAPLLVFTGFYLYPSSEKSSMQKKIAQELPFATIHMAAIASSDIGPLPVFKIIAKSKEYTALGTELKKVIAQVEFYGYDVVTALKNIAQQTSHARLSDLLSGIATNIGTGGSLKNFLETKSENFLVDYRLERQKYNDLAGTFMDVYISLLIAAPLVLMMMFIVMNVSGLGVGGLSITTLLFLSIAVVAIVNIIFIVVLNMKQPST